MKRSTVLRHFTEMSEVAQHLATVWPAEESPLCELWVGGDLLHAGSEIEHVVAILVLDVPPDELTEITLHDAEQALDHSLRLDKRPMITRSRPVGRPAWSHLERRVARIWSAADGVDERNLRGLATPMLSGAEVVQPSDEELRDWLETELGRSEAHLREVLDRYWEGTWRRDHAGGGIHPDDHLWWAAWAVQSMRDALRELTERSARS